MAQVGVGGKEELVWSQLASVAGKHSSSNDVSDSQLFIIAKEVFLNWVFHRFVISNFIVKRIVKTTTTKKTHSSFFL